MLAQWFIFTHVTCALISIIILIPLFVIFMHPFLSSAWLFPSAPCGMCASRRVSTFPGISLGTDNRSQKEGILEFRGVAAATRGPCTCRRGYVRRMKRLRLFSQFPFWLLSRGDFPREPHVTARDRFPEQPDRTPESSRCNYRLAFFPMLSRTLDISQLTVAVLRLWRFLSLFETSGKKNNR